MYWLQQTSTPKPTKQTMAMIENRTDKQSRFRLATVDREVCAQTFRITEAFSGNSSTAIRVRVVLERTPKCDCLNSNCIFNIRFSTRNGWETARPKTPKGHMKAEELGKPLVPEVPSRRMVIFRTSLVESIRHSAIYGGKWRNRLPVRTCTPDVLVGTVSLPTVIVVISTSQRATAERRRCESACLAVAASACAHASARVERESTRAAAPHTTRLDIPAPVKDF